MLRRKEHDMLRCSSNDRGSWYELERSSTGDGHALLTLNCAEGSVQLRDGHGGDDDEDEDEEGKEERGLRDLISKLSSGGDQEEAGELGGGLKGLAKEIIMVGTPQTSNTSNLSLENSNFDQPFIHTLLSYLAGPTATYAGDDG